MSDRNKLIDKIFKHIDVILLVTLLISIGFDVYKIWFQ